MFQRLLLYWRTVQWLRWRQLWYQLWYRLVPHRVPRTPSVSRRKWVKSWRGVAWRKSQLINANTIVLLNVEGSIDEATCWNATEAPMLWLYELHYFSDLAAIDAGQRVEWHRYLIDRWIDENQPGKGVGWDPFPVSMRIVNWVKFFTRHNDLPPKWIESLKLQAQWLFERPEFHLMANHLFVNAKALVFAGMFFDGPAAEAWLKKGLALIGVELDEQFLADGGHFERSPMYHSAVLWDLLELYELRQCTDPVSLASLGDKLESKIMPGHEWLQKMSHPDGGVAFFNDACLEKEPALADVERYMSMLGITKRASKLVAAEHLGPSGYLRISVGPAVALIDAGKVGPAYQPGHAHAGTLSFELSIDRQRVLVNSGTSVYAPGDLRCWQRSTAAHNTVVIDGENSSETWAEFRVARRVAVLDAHLESSPLEVRATCACKGYQRSAPLHRRSWKFTPDRLTVRDQIDGEFGMAAAYYYFQPDISVVQTSDNSGTLMVLEGRTIKWEISHGLATVKSTEFYPQFGAMQRNQCLVVENTDSCISVNFEWG